MNNTEFRTHGLWDDLDAINEATFLSEAQSLPGMSRRLDEVRELVAIVMSFRQSEDYSRFSTGMVDRMQSAWSSILHFLTNYGNPRNSARYLDGVFEQLDSVREVLATWPKPEGSAEAQAAFNRALDMYLSELEQQRAVLAEQMSSAVAENASLREQASELVRAVKRAQQDVSRLEKRVADGEERLANALTQNNETFNGAQTAREESFRDWLLEREATFVHIVAPYVASVESAVLVAEENLEVVKGLRTSTVEMAGMTTGDLMADEYRKHAKTERITSFVAYAVGLAASLASIAIVLFSFESLTEATDWRQVVLKLSLTVGVGAVATVAFRFAGQAVRRATSFKRQELELRALYPLLKDVEGADGAKTAFLERAFGHSWVESSAGKSEPELNDALLKLLTTAVQQATKSNTASS